MIEATSLTTTVLSDQQVEADRVALQVKKDMVRVVIAAFATDTAERDLFTEMILG